METTKLLYYPVLDIKREKAQEIEKSIAAWLYKDLNITNNEEEATAYLVWWWDGFMLDTIKKKYDFEKSPEENKLFFWVNCGTLWFLLNDVKNIDAIPKTFEEVDKVRARLMKVEVLKTDAQKEIKYAINDVVIGGNLLDYFKFDITSWQINKRFHGTGVIVSTALGSSAYWLNNGGPILPAESQLRWISGLASLPFGHQVVKPEEIKIHFKGRTPIIVGVDGYGGKVDDAQEVTLTPTTHYATIAFLKDTPFDTKRMLLAEEKLLREDF